MRYGWAKRSSRELPGSLDTLSEEYLAVRSAREPEQAVSVLPYGISCSVVGRVSGGSSWLVLSVAHSEP